MRPVELPGRDEASLRGIYPSDLSSEETWVDRCQSVAPEVETCRPLGLMQTEIVVGMTTPAVWGVVPPVQICVTHFNGRNPFRRRSHLPDFYRFEIRIGEELCAGATWRAVQQGGLNRVVAARGGSHDDCRDVFVATLGSSDCAVVQFLVVGCGLVNCGWLAVCRERRMGGERGRKIVVTVRPRGLCKLLREQEEEAEKKTGNCVFEGNCQMVE